jgi:hypothetical protein
VLPAAEEQLLCLVGVVSRDDNVDVLLLLLKPTFEIIDDDMVLF